MFSLIQLVVYNIEHHIDDYIQVYHVCFSNITNTIPILTFFTFPATTCPFSSTVFVPSSDHTHIYIKPRTLLENRKLF